MTLYQAQPLSFQSQLITKLDRLSAVDMSQAPKISVIVTSFNYRQYIEQAINSALAQSRAPSEIIVVDDGSTDGSQQFLKDRFGQIETIQIVTTPNRGQLSAICEGFLRSTGDAIALLDADDTWDPSYLERVSSQFSRMNSIDFILVNVKFFGAQSGVWNESTRDLDFGLTSCLTSLSDPPPWIGRPTSAICLRRELFEQLLPLDELYSDWKVRADDCLVFGASILGAHKYSIADALVNYRVHGANNWANKGWSAVNGCKYEIKKQRMLNYHRKKAYGSSMPNSHVLHFEFKTTSHPSLSRLWKYLSILPKTSGNRLVKLKVAFMLTKYWWKQLFEKVEEE